MKKVFILICVILLSNNAFAQYADDYDGGFKIKFNEDGSKYMRVLMWGQFWVQNKETPSSSTADALDISVRRARMLAFAQINKRFMMLAHFGSNSLLDTEISSSGKGEGSQIFFHDVWGEFNVVDQLQIGAGLHYWNGINRLNNQSTINMMTLDNVNSRAWATLNITDQFARHLGIYAKGVIAKKFGYQVAVNDTKIPLSTLPTGSGDFYAGKMFNAKKADLAYSGYFNYFFGDAESYLLPFRVGTYLGTKKIFNLGAGFFAHPNGIVHLENNEVTKFKTASHLSFDAFLDRPLGETGGITWYGSFLHSFIGNDYSLVLAGTGNTIYTHAGYLIPKNGGGMKNRFQPYLAYTNINYKKYESPLNIIGIGVNWFLAGHNAKLTAQWDNTSAKWYTDEQKQSNSTFTIQAQIVL